MELDAGRLAFLFGLLAAASFGTGDFSGGLATRRGSVFGVVVFSQLTGLTLLLLSALALAEPLPSVRTMLLGSAAGIAGLIGLIALYSGLAGGRMGVVSPLSAMMTGVLPLFVSVITEGVPGAAQLSGFGVALLAVLLLTRSGASQGIRRHEIGLAALSGIGFGLFFILIDRAGEEAILWPLVAARVTSVALLSIAAISLRRLRRPTRSQIPIIVLAGLFDAAGNAFFALSAREGRLDIATILSSLHPAATVILAWLVLKERLRLQQRVGVVIALIALVLIAS